MRLRVAVQADVADLGDRHDGEEAVHHTQPRAQDGHDGQLFAQHLAPRCFADRRLNLDRLVGRSRVISYAISIEISLKRSRKSFAPVSLHRISVSLCAIIG